MSGQARFMLVASPLMEHSPAFDRAAALAKAEDAALHIVAFDYLEGLATAGLVNEKGSGADASGVRRAPPPVA